MKKIRSARGVSVDFDLLKIKEQIAAAPESNVVRDRQDFIEKRLRRRKAKARTAVAEPQKEVEVEPDMPTAEPAAELIDEKVEEAPKPKTKQKARTTKKKRTTKKTTS